MFLKNIGVLGFDPLEKVILAALLTEEPMLIIGKPGTDKANLLAYITYLGYRINSKIATQFRIWATQRLKE
jgi:hypothetical protein